MKKKKTETNNKKGQILLMAILLSTVLITVALSITQLTIQESKTAKLEEESKKAFAAAEAALEARLKAAGDINDIKTLSLGEDIVSGSATKEYMHESEFLTPLLKKDEQYTFYLASYDLDTKSFTGSAFNGRLKISHSNIDEDICSNDTKEFALVLTFINAQNFTVNHRIIDPCNLINGGNKWEFNVEYSPPSFPSSHLLVLRVIASRPNFSGTQIKIQNLSGNWPSQGSFITSSATTKAGVSKKIQLFQSYPQIPVDFFVTRF